MTATARRSSGRRARSRARPAARLASWGLRLFVVVLAFVVGLALGRALEDNPEPGRDRTYVRTLQPRAVSPARETVTVTVTR